jgi:hypothetical protein
MATSPNGFEYDPLPSKVRKKARARVVEIKTSLFLRSITLPSFINQNLNAHLKTSGIIVIALTPCQAHTGASRKG